MRGARAIVGLCGTLVVGGACTTELPVAALHETITAWFGRDGIALDVVDCPQALARAREASTVCRAELGAEAIEVTVTVTDDEGTLAVRASPPVVVAARAEPEVAATLRAQGYAVARVRCEGPAWVARAGAEHRCEVTNEDGQRFAWHGVWTGEGTKQRTRVVPLGAEIGANR